MDSFFSEGGAGSGGVGLCGCSFDLLVLGWGVGIGVWRRLCACLVVETRVGFPRRDFSVFMFLFFGGGGGVGKGGEEGFGKGGFRKGEGDGWMEKVFWCGCFVYCEGGGGGVTG